MNVILTYFATETATATDTERRTLDWRSGISSILTNGASAAAAAADEERETDNADHAELREVPASIFSLRIGAHLARSRRLMLTKCSVTQSACAGWMDLYVNLGNRAAGA